MINPAVDFNVTLSSGMCFNLPNPTAISPAHSPLLMPIVIASDQRERGNPEKCDKERLDCFATLAMTRQTTPPISSAHSPLLITHSSFSTELCSCRESIGKRDATHIWILGICLRKTENDAGNNYPTTPISSAHSPLLMPLVSCVTFSPASMRLITAMPLAEISAPPTR